VKLAALLILCAGCLGPRVSDELEEEGAGILPAGSIVPSADGTPLDATISMKDGLAGTVPRRSVFAGGAPAHAWDLGNAPDFAMPVFVLVRETAPGTYEELDHPPIADSIPGKPTYSPFASIFYVEVTDAYAGEILTSTYAVQEAVDRGLVAAPYVAKEGMHAPIVGSDVMLDTGAAPLAPATRMYWNGVAVRFYDFGEFELPDGVHVAAAPRYVLRRDGSEPLSEPIREIDMDGDGDTLDSNDVYDVSIDSPRRRTINVAVPPSTASIDTSKDERVADLKDATQLFDPAPTSTVLAFEATDEYRDLPLQTTPGGL